MQYLGIDWGTRRAAWCALSPGGELTEGTISADGDGLVRLVTTLGPEVRGRIEMMSGAPWVRDSLQACGWEIEIADARKVKAIAPLACKTDRVDARVLADLARRDLIPTVWVPPLDDRAIRERLRRRSHLIRLRTSSINRTFGLLTQWGLRRNLTALRQPGALDELAERGVPAVWRDSLAVLLDVIDDLDRQLAPLERELRPLARSDERARLLMSIPGVAELLALTLASEIGGVRRFPTAGKLVGYSGLTPRIKQSGQSSRVGRISKAGPDTLRWAAVEAAQHAWPTSNPWHQLYSEIKRRHGKANPAKAAVARKILIASWHILHRNQPFKPAAPRAADPVPASSSIRLAHRGPQRSEKPGQLPPDHMRDQAPKEISAPAAHDPSGAAHRQPAPADTPTSFKETSGWSAAATCRRSRSLSSAARTWTCPSPKKWEGGGRAPSGLSCRQPHRRSKRRGSTPRPGT